MTPGPFPWIDATVAGLHFCQWSTVIAAALIGGVAFASEREDSSDRFFFALPVRRSDAAMSKFIVAIVSFESMWLLLGLIGHASVPFAAMDARSHLPGAASPFAIAAFSFLVLSASWCWSALVAKPVLAAVSGIVTSILGLLAVYAMVRALTPVETPMTYEQIAPWAWPIGIVGFVFGAKLYLAGDHQFRGTLDRQSAATASPSHSVLRWPKRVHPIQALLWKDRRLAQTIVLAGTAALVLPYVFPLLAQWRDREALEAFARTTTQTLWLSCIVFAIWGGYSVSVERASQTDRFLQSLPIRPGSIVGSRLITTFIPALTIFLVNISAMLVLHVLTFRQSPVDEPVDGFFDMTWQLLVFQANSLMFAMPTFGMPLVCFGVAWYGAIALNRPYLGIGLGVAAPGLVLLVWLSFITLVEDALGPIQAGLVFLAAGVLASLLLLALGYRKMNRAEPA